MIKIRELELKKTNKVVLTVPQITLENQNKYLILGPNNTGKSVFLSYIHSGECLEIDKGKEKRVRSVLIDCQNNLFDDKTVWENLCVGVNKPTATKKSLIKTLLGKVNLDNYLNNKAGTLCYSHKKLVEIIRATAINPLLILVDDLDKYFDDLNVIKAAGILSFATQEGATVIASSGRKLFGFEQNFIIKEGNLCPEGVQIETQQP